LQELRSRFVVALAFAKVNVPASTGAAALICGGDAASSVSDDNLSKSHELRSGGEPLRAGADTP
jgi:hypothetical protein